jgi:exodeoxyribonuclease VIII
VEYGLFDISDSDYRKLPALSNHELQLFAKDASLYMWNKNAPVDPNKSATAEFGKALHVMILEPDNFDEKIMVSSVKGKTTQKFISEQIENPDKIVVTESELDQLKVMKLSAMANPMFKRIMDADGKGEQSIVVHDDERNIDLKIRVDWLIDSLPLPCDLKTTADIEDWRSDKQWINPLYKMGYGLTAAFYLYVMELHYKKEMSEYIFPIVQKSASLGRYPVSVFRITKDELCSLGFWDATQANINNFAEAFHSNKFTSFEQFPNFQ